MPDVIKRNTIVCYISDAILGTYFQLPIWIIYQSQFLSYSQIALYAGISLMTEVIAQLPTGAFADLIGRKHSLSLGNLFMAIPMFLIAFFPRPEIMLLYSVMWGLGRAFAMGTSKPILYETLAANEQAHKYSRILSRSVVSFQLSAAVSITLGGYLYQLSPNLPYIVSGLASLLGIFTSQLFIEERLGSSKFSLPAFVNTSKKGFIEIFKNSFITKFTLLYTLTLGIAQSSQQFFIQPFMLELGMNEIERSWTAMIIKVFIALLGARIIASTKVINHKYYLLIIPLLMASSLLPAGAVSLPSAYLVFIGIAFISGNTDLFYSPEINKHLASSVRSTAVSLQRMLASSFAAVIQWLSILVVSKSGVGGYYSYLGIFTLIAIIPLAYNLATTKRQ